MPCPALPCPALAAALTLRSLDRDLSPQDYEEGDKLSTLPACFHAYHDECISRWLADKPTCPICARDVRQDVR